MAYTLVDNMLTIDDFIRLFASAGWGEMPRDVVETALQNSYATFAVKENGRVIAMARLLGDGAMAFFLKDFVVEPAFQGKGVGRMLMNHIEAYIRQKLHPGWEGYLQLVSAKGKEGFYQHMGYAMHPHETSGAGMSKWIIR